MKSNFFKIALKVIFDIFLIILCLIGIVLFLLWKDTFDPYDNTINTALIPNFEKFELDTGHAFNTETSLPVRGSTLIDFNNDGVDEIFLGGGAWQADQVFSYEGGKFIDVSEQYSISKGENDNSLAASSVDLDNNGFSDLIVSRDRYISIYFNDGTSLEEQRPELGLNDISSPLGLTFGDINKDGFLDLFLSTYIIKEEIDGLTNFSEGYGSTSALLLNNGDNTFENITSSAGLEYIHNTFQGVFVDLNDDTFLDLVVAYDTGEPRIYKNNGNTTFTLQENPFTGKFAYPMGIGIGDYDNDGDSDIYFSNIGSTLPKVMVKGDLENTDDLELGWFLLRNDGEFSFTDTAEETLIQDYEFSWGGVFHDMNNDGLQDLMVAENFVDLSFQKLFKLPGRFLLQKHDGTFAATGKQSGTTNKHYGITPLVSDFNNDGAQDLVWVNIAGKSYAFIQENNLENNYISLQFPETAEYVGAHVTVELTDGTELYDTYVVGEGLVADQSNVLHFGLGDTTSIDRLRVRLVTGKEIVIGAQPINTILDISDYE